jgi:DNA-binding transcriptional ArsR family regulator
MPDTESTPHHLPVFLSFSGPRSRAVAEALRKFLPEVIQAIRPWVSSEDIESGAPWWEELKRNLTRHNYGVLCLTTDCLDAKWLHFEAGALMRTVGEGRVCPYLVDLKPSRLKGPLGMLAQASEATKDGTRKLVNALNNGVAPGGFLTEERLETAFSREWPRLEAVLSALPEPEKVEVVRATEQAEHSTGEMFEELVAQMRRVERIARRLEQQHLGRAPEGGVGALHIPATGEYGFSRSIPRSQNEGWFEPHVPLKGGDREALGEGTLREEDQSK